jgi:hypothetical protein
VDGHPKTGFARYVLRTVRQLDFGRFAEFKIPFQDALRRPEGNRQSEAHDRFWRIVAVDVAAVACGTSYRAWSMCEGNAAYV